MKNSLEKYKINSHLQSRLSDRTLMIDSLISNLDGMIYCCLPDNQWTMVFISNGCKVLTGYNPEDLLFNNKISFENLTHPEDRDLARNSINEAIKTYEKYSVENRILRANNQICWVWDRGSVIYDEDGNLVAIEGFVQDISHKKLQEQALQNLEICYRSIFENAVEGIFQTSLSGHYLAANKALANIYGYSSPEELIENLVNIQSQLYVDPNRRNEFKLTMEINGVIKDFESEIYRKNGEIAWISENTYAISNKNGDFLYYQGSVVDITLRRLHKQEMEYQAGHDQLTKLPNRYLLEDRLHQAINNAKRYNKKVAIAFLDLDYFKSVNDSLGHEAGDQLLCIVAERLTSTLRDIDTVVRLGGDEFVILLGDISEDIDFSNTMKRVLDSVAKTYTFNDQDFKISCSIGLTIYPEDGAEANLLLKNADAAMYQAKKMVEIIFNDLHIS